MFTSDDLRRIRSGTSVRHIELFEEVESTNDAALHLSAGKHTEYPALVLTARQTAGRGRGSNRWWSAAGALTFSVVVQADPARLEPRNRPQVSLASGLAVCRCLSEHLTDNQPRLKWPNDVYVQDRKICGILAETPVGKPDRLVVGIGINVNNSLAGAPPDIRGMATSLFDQVGQPRDPIAVLVSVLNHLELILEWLGTDPARLAAEWQPFCLLTGRDVQLKAGEQDHSGHCLGIAEDGALLLQTAAGNQRHYAGVVSRW